MKTVLAISTTLNFVLVYNYIQLKRSYRNTKVKDYLDRYFSQLD